MSGSGSSIGQMGPTDATDTFNSIVFVVRQMFGFLRTATIVKVNTVNAPAQPGPTGTVDVQPLVYLVDGDLKFANEDAPIFGLPYLRVQGGTNAVICDPVVGDLGLAVFADRDISQVKAKQGAAPPGSFRRHDMADGVYLFSLLTGAPNSYVQFKPDGTINIKSPVAVNISAPNTTTSGNLVAGNGITTSFTTPTGQTVIVQDGIVVNIY